jgi:hypothetical protein
MGRCPDERTGKRVSDEVRGAKIKIPGVNNMTKSSLLYSALLACIFAIPAHADTIESATLTGNCAGAVHLRGAFTICPKPVSFTHIVPTVPYALIMTAGSDNCSRINYVVEDPLTGHELGRTDYVAPGKQSLEFSMPQGKSGESLTLDVYAVGNFGACAKQAATQNWTVQVDLVAAENVASLVVPIAGHPPALLAANRPQGH